MLSRVSGPLCGIPRGRTWAPSDGARAQKEQYALFSFGRTVIQAVEIESLERTTIYSGNPDEKRDDRYTIHGRILGKGHPVFDK